MMRFLVFVILLCGVSVTLADQFSPATQYQVCFTPGEDCTGEILAILNNAKQSIWVQAFLFTSKPIAKALVCARQRGVDVKVIMDKNTSIQDQYSHHIRDYLLHAGIPIWLDATVSIAHNKVMVVDGNTVITGSFNFTRAAQLSNAENLLIIEDPILAQKYAENWRKRLEKSESFH